MRPNPQKTADSVTLSEKILNGKLHFLCSGMSSSFILILSTKLSSFKCTNFEQKRILLGFCDIQNIGRKEKQNIFD